MKLIFYSDEDFVNHAAKMINGSLYTSNATVTKDDKLLVLQVCYYNPPGSYLIIICKEKKWVLIWNLLFLYICVKIII